MLSKVVVAAWQDQVWDSSNFDEMHTTTEEVLHTKWDSQREDCSIW